MQKYWRWCIERWIPEWWAPNAMTLIGLIINVLACLLLVFYSPDSLQSIPPYALIMAAFGLFIYQTLDACDGKQARRTRTSSSLGELFDHGCDAVSTIFVSLSVCLSVQLGSYSNWMVVLCSGATSLFYIAHWQAYVSGTLKFGKFDVTEAQFTIIFIHLISAFFGCEFWAKKIFGIELRLFPMSFTVANECFVFLRDLKSILSGGAGKNGSTIAGTSILSPIIPLLLVFSLTLIIYSKSMSMVFVNHICLYIITFGFVSAKITCKLVVAHMSKSEMSKLDTILFGPSLLFFNQYFNFYFNEYIILWIAFVSFERLIYTLLDFCYFCYSTCRQLANHLNVYILTIQKRPDRSIGSGVGVGSPIGGGNSGLSSSKSNGRDQIVTRQRTGHHQHHHHNHHHSNHSRR
ncbi:choline/ethanolaminephosphotransferase 1-like protein [Sarcoptes scabiei]|uniref:diacylglycerol cholinephosphotransferase n=1 Tax=Sarcoptes scabiei TaxID=52283 RepID=A0A132AIT1_SARSC|nr:choline/ethanolaminephosphotransferase 1-like protein [Sarcoptes scabiei]